MDSSSMTVLELIQNLEAKKKLIEFQIDSIRAACPHQFVLPNSNTPSNKCMHCGKFQF